MKVSGQILPISCSVRIPERQCQSESEARGRNKCTRPPHTLSSPPFPPYSPCLLAAHCPSPSYPHRLLPERYAEEVVQVCCKVAQHAVRQVLLWGEAHHPTRGTGYRGRDGFKAGCHTACSSTAQGAHLCCGCRLRERTQLLAIPHSSKPVRGNSNHQSRPGKLAGRAPCLSSASPPQPYVPPSPPSSPGGCDEQAACAEALPPVVAVAAACGRLRHKPCELLQRQRLNVRGGAGVGG